MSDGNRNPEGFRTEECSSPGRGLYPRILCRPEGRKGMEADTDAHRKGRFWGPRLDDTAQFPIATAHAFGEWRFPTGEHVNPDDDMITSKLPALQLYQLAMPSPQPPARSFYPGTADRGDEVFSGKAKCNSCHVEPLWSDPGWNLHTLAEVSSIAFTPTVRQVIAIELRP
jgi:hypothetical protein